MTDTDQFVDEGDRVDQDHYWRIEELDLESETYCFIGKGGPPSSDAVAKAKKQFAQDHDVEYRHTMGKKIATAPGRAGGAIVHVAHRPRLESQEVLP